MHIVSSSYWWLSLLHSQRASKHVTNHIRSVFETRPYVQSIAIVGVKRKISYSARARGGIQTNHANSVNASIKWTASIESTRKRSTFEAGRY